MTLWAITYRNRPMTLGKLEKLERGGVSHWFNNDWEKQQCVIATSRRDAIKFYLHYVGFSWAERRKGIEVMKITTMLGQRYV